VAPMAEGEKARVEKASKIGLPGWPGSWPETFDHDGKLWTKGQVVVAQKIHEVMYAEYSAPDVDNAREWIIVTNQ
jgi:hypothetical protein